MYITETMTVCVWWPTAKNANISKSEKGSIRMEVKGACDLRAGTIF